MKRSRPKIGIALSGGAARGFAHIGVLKTLEEENFPIDCIAGTSMGAIIAGAYSAGVSLSQLAELARSVRWSDVSKMIISRLGLMSSEPLEKLLRRLMPVTDFSKMRIPLGVVAADIKTGQAIVFTEGDAARAIRISCTVPGIYEPVIDEQGRMLVDGGLAQNLPSSVALQLGANKVIAVDVNADIEMSEAPTNVFQVVVQSLMIMGRASVLHQASRAHLVIQPKAGWIRADELEKAGDLISAGEDAMRAALPAARALLEDESDSLWVRFRKSFSSERPRPEPAK